MPTNAERSATTRRRLIDAARPLFAAEGYSAAGTERILAAAGVPRGAMYHHFSDKADLFAAVCEAIGAEAARAVLAAAEGQAGAFEALLAGSVAWLDSVARDDVRRILLVDAPMVLGWERWHDLDRRHGEALLREGVRAAFEARELRFAAGAEPFATMLNGALNALALRSVSRSDRGAARDRRQAVRCFLEAFRGDRPG